VGPGRTSRVPGALPGRVAAAYFLRDARLLDSFCVFVLPVVPSKIGGTRVAHPVSWFHISVGSDDLEAVEAFYKEVFGWGMTVGIDGTTRMIAPETGGIAGGLGASPDGRANIAVYANVEDLAGHLKKVQDAGGQVAMPPMELGGGMGWIGGFTDPAGNWFGLWQPGEAAAPEPKAAAKKAPRKKAPAKKAPAAAKKAPAKKAPAKKAPAKKKKK
jgi:predicted enzyme related to lactoylglutathione lyase